MEDAAGAGGGVGGDVGGVVGPGGGVELGPGVASRDEAHADAITIATNTTTSFRIISLPPRRDEQRAARRAFLRDLHVFAAGELEHRRDPREDTVEQQVRCARMPRQSDL